MDKEHKRIRASIVIPVLNEENRLPTLLDSIQAQIFDPTQIEVLIVDGGSTDRTREIATSYGYKVVDNPQKLGDIGSLIGYRAAQGDIVILTAGDTAFTKDTFIAQVEQVFQAESDVAVGFCAVDTDPSDTKNSVISRYINLGTDPFNVFVYGRGYCYYPRLHEYITPVKDTNSHTLYKFTIKEHPLLAVAQGFIMHKKRFPEHLLAHMEGGDIFPVLKMIEHELSFAYIKDQPIKHYIFTDLKHFFKKMDRKINLAFQNPGKWGFQRRESTLNSSRKIRKYLFIPYAFFVVPSFVHALFWYGKEKRNELLIHPFVSFVVLLLIAKQFLKSKF